MYFGSVRFFRHLIIGMILVLITASTTAALYFAYQITGYKAQVDGLKAELNIISTEDHDRGGMLANTVYAAELDYQKLYPELKVEPPQQQRYLEKMVYLTFDDGPSIRTIEILKVLKEYNVKATFFVIGKTDDQSKEIMRQIVAEGHSIGIHTFSHKYAEIYSSVASYLDDFNKQYQLIYEATGVKPEIFRFPGGSINAYNSSVYQQIIAEMSRRGFTFFDWNASAGDTLYRASSSSVTLASLEPISKSKRVILLAHDSIDKSIVVSALPAIIRGYQQAGYDFDRLTQEVKPISFSYTQSQ